MCFSRERTIAESLFDPAHINEISGQIVDAAIRVHTALGPGLLESTYETCLVFELTDRGLPVARQRTLPITYRGHKIDAGYRIDLLVAELVIVEIKAIDKLTSLHDAQLLTYLRLADKRLGLLLNFNVLHLKDGIKRIAHNL